MCAWERELVSWSDVRDYCTVECLAFTPKMRLMEILGITEQIARQFFVCFVTGIVKWLGIMMNFDFLVAVRHSIMNFLLNIKQNPSTMAVRGVKKTSRIHDGTCIINITQQNCENPLRISSSRPINRRRLWKLFCGWSFRKERNWKDFNVDNTISNLSARDY